MDVINKYMIPALDFVGNGFEKKTLFLPQLLMSADAAKAAFEVIREAVGVGETQGETVIIATVHGDIHDIGKNIVKVLLENYGYRVLDLGKDVPVEAIVNAAKESGAKVVGLSALMTTTVGAMEATIKALQGVYQYADGALLHALRTGDDSGARSYAEVGGEETHGGAGGKDIYMSGISVEGASHHYGVVTIAQLSRSRARARV